MQSCLKGREEFLKSTVSKSAFKNAYNSEERKLCRVTHGAQGNFWRFTQSTVLRVEVEMPILVLKMQQGMSIMHLLLHRVWKHFKKFHFFGECSEPRFSTVTITIMLALIKAQTIFQECDFFGHGFQLLWNCASSMNFKHSYEIVDITVILQRRCKLKDSVKEGKMFLHHHHSSSF